MPRQRFAATIILIIAVLRFVTHCQHFAYIPAVNQTEEDTPTPQGPTKAEAPVTIRILDINDQVPTFNKSHYEATVQENTLERIPVTLLPVGSEMIVRDMDEVYMCGTCWPCQ